MILVMSFLLIFLISKEIYCVDFIKSKLGGPDTLENFLSENVVKGKHFKLCFYLGEADFKNLLIKNNNCPCLIDDLGVNVPLFPTVSVTFVAFNNLVALDEYLDLLFKMYFWKPIHPTVFILTKTLEGVGVTGMIKHISERKVVRFHVVAVREDVQVFNYYKFQQQQITNNKSLIVTYEIDHKINFHKNPLRASFFEYEPLMFKESKKITGLDYYKYKTIITMLNATPYVCMNSDNSYRTAEDQVYNDETDYVAVSNFETYVHPYTSYPIKLEKLVLLVPSSGEATPFAKMSKIVDKYTWILLASSFLSVAMVVKFLHNHKSPIWINFFLTWRILTQSSVPHLRCMEGKIKLFISVWILCSMIIFSVFVSNVLSVLLVHQYNNNIDTIKEFLEQNNNVYTIKYYLDLISEDLEDFKARCILMPPELVTNLKEHINLNYSYLLRYEIASFIKQTFIDDQGEDYFHIVGEAVTYGVNNYLFQNNSPYVDIFNDIMLLYKQFGFNRYDFDTRLKQKKRSIVTQALIQFHTFKYFCISLCFCYFVCILVFIAERCY